MLNVRILTPSQLLFEGEADSITLPGTVGSFTVLPGHAPIISSLEKGKVICRIDDVVSEYVSNGGFVEVKNDTVSVCID